jgi:hypothetical protein
MEISNHERRNRLKKLLSVAVLAMALAASVSPVAAFGPLPPPPVEDVHCEPKEICFLGICVIWGCASY